MTKQKSKLKVMHLTHTMDKGENGTFSITTKEQAPKLRNAVDPVDPIQQAESTAHVPVKTKASKPPVVEDQLTKDQRQVLEALHALGGKDVHTPEIVMHCAHVKDLKAALKKWGSRGKVRDAMTKLSNLGLVNSSKDGLKYKFSILPKGVEALKDKPKSGSTDATHHPPAETVKAKTPPATASTASSGSTPPKLKEAVMERPSNTDLECYACRTFNPYMAIHCKNCGQLLRPPVPFLKA